MKTIELNIYEFSELSENVKEKVISNLSYINVDYEWWDFIYYDARQVDLKISEFDIYIKSIKIDFIHSAEETAKKIKSEHGENCSIWKLADTFLYELNKLDENKDDYEDDIEYLEDDFLSDLGEEYLSIFNEQYEYLTSEEAIIETIEANGYQFTENGKIAG